ncbi:ArdC-like ssDNA-binding domain-containing protein [Chloroflexota bacterium]
MAGQAVVIINDREWQVTLATAPWELTQGLGGIPEMPQGTGMLFDLGFEQAVTVTTEPMLFPLDITFLSEALVVTEVFRNIQPGYLVSSTLPARYFLEVNAGELEGVGCGEQVLLELLPLEGEVINPDWISTFVPFIGFALMGIFLIAMVKDLSRTMFTDTPETHLLSESKQYERTGRSASKCSFCAVSYRQCEICERVSPRDYHLLSWFGTPVPDYSFAIEPETKERRVDEVLRKLKEGVDGILQSDNFRKFLLTMSKFHNYSIGNLMLIMLQKPDATRVAGFNTWKDLGRWVKKGEKGIAILAPCLPPKGPKQETPEAATGDEDEERKGEETEIRPLYFKVVYVFDVSQTEGKALPEFEVPSLTGEANEGLFKRVMHLAEAQGVVVSFEQRPNQDPDIKGIYCARTIWIRPEESRAQQLKTLLHEVAHYYSEGVFRIPRADAETIAESVAFTIGAHFGFDTGVRSFPYVALWSEDKKTLEANLAAIRKVSTNVIDALESPSNKLVGVA